MHPGWRLGFQRQPRKRPCMVMLQEALRVRLKHGCCPLCESSSKDNRRFSSSWQSSWPVRLQASTLEVRTASSSAEIVTRPLLRNSSGHRPSFQQMTEQFMSSTQRRQNPKYEELYATKLLREKHEIISFWMYVVDDAKWESCQWAVFVVLFRFVVHGFRPQADLSADESSLTAARRVCGNH